MSLRAQQFIQFLWNKNVAWQKDLGIVGVAVSKMTEEQVFELIRDKIIKNPLEYKKLVSEWVDITRRKFEEMTQVVKQDSLQPPPKKKMRVKPPNIIVSNTMENVVFPITNPQEEKGKIKDIDDKLLLQDFDLFQPFLNPLPLFVKSNNNNTPEENVENVYDFIDDGMFHHSPTTSFDDDIPLEQVMTLVPEFSKEWTLPESVSTTTIPMTPTTIDNNESVFINNVRKRINNIMRQSFKYHTMTISGGVANLMWYATLDVLSSRIEEELWLKTHGTKNTSNGQDVLFS